MLILESITAKNFLSIGNCFQTIDLNRDNITLVMGENLDVGGEASNNRNGTGKTVLLNAISFALYGSAISNIKKDNLVNQINKKNMIVVLTFSINGVQYKIERGRKPAILRFYINNEEKILDDAQGEMRETQKYIESIIGISHDMFKHIVALNTYTEPFLSLKAADQRAIIEQLLGITLLSEKAESLKIQIKETKDEIFQENAKLEAIKKSNEHIEETIKNLKLKQRAWSTNRNAEINNLESNISKLIDLDIDAEIEKHEQLSEYTNYIKKLTSLNKEKRTLENAISQALKTGQKHADDLVVLSNNKCPTCQQELLDHDHVGMLNEAIKNVDDSAKYLKSVQSDLDSINDQITDLVSIDKPETFYETIKDAYDHRNTLESLAIQLENKLNETDAYADQITELSNSALQVLDWTAMNELVRKREHQEFLLKLLTNKDSFARKKIIDQNLAHLNTRLSHYLELMGLPHLVMFQNDLSVEITQLGQDLDFDNLSRGERNRLILGLSWAFRDVWEGLYQGINLMFIDEVIDSGLDPSGVENAINILKSMSRDRNKSVFLISHRDELINRVNHVLKVIKENGFTTYLET